MQTAQDTHSVNIITRSLIEHRNDDSSNHDEDEDEARPSPGRPQVFGIFSTKTFVEELIPSLRVQR